MKKSALEIALSGLAAVALAILVVWPIAATAIRFGAETPALEPEPGTVIPGMAQARWSRPAGLAISTLKVTAVAEAIALGLGVPLAFILFRTDALGRRVTLAIVLCSAFIPLPLYATEWLGSFGNIGRAQVLGVTPFLKGWAGAGFVHAMAALPWVTLLAGLAFATVEPELEEASLLDHSALKTTLLVTLPRSLLGLGAAALAVVVLTAGEMTVTDLLSVRTYAEEAYLQYQLGNERGAAATALSPALALALLLFFAGSKVLALGPERLPSFAAQGRRWRLGPARLPAGLLTLGLAAAFAGFPLASLAWRAGRVGGNAAQGLGPRFSFGGLATSLTAAADDLKAPLATSLALGSAAALAAAALAWSVAWSCRDSQLWRLATGLAVAILLGAPGPVVGSALVVAYRRIPAVYDHQTVMVIAYLTRIFPYALLLLWPSVRGIPERALEAAAVDGLGPFDRFTKVALPLSAGPIFAAFAASLVLALGELPASFLVETPGSTTLAKRTWELMHTGVESRLAGVALISTAVMAAGGAVVGLAVSRFSPQREGFLAEAQP